MTTMWWSLVGVLVFVAVLSVAGFIDVARQRRAERH